MHRYFVTGTDTDVGKTRIAACLARAARENGHPTTIVKCAQTGSGPGDVGDAERAGKLAEVAHLELARFALPADPWSAALAEPAEPLVAGALAAQIDAIAGAVVVEGTGGIAVPFNPRESMADVARLAGLEVVFCVGLQLGCINHSLLSLAFCQAQGLRVAGAVLVERTGVRSAAYRSDVERCLQDKTRVLGILPFCADEPSAIVAGSHLFDPLFES